jgi:putative addiction module killer protein
MIEIRYTETFSDWLLQRGKELIILLVGGDKSSQNRDIQKAQDLAKRL